MHLQVEFAKLLVLLMSTLAIFAIGCSKDDDGKSKEPDYPSVIGTWADIDIDDIGEIGVSWTFNSSGVAIQRAWVIMYGVTLRDIKTNFTYSYDGKTITTTDSSGNRTIHSVSITGRTMIFGDGAGGYFTLIKQ